VAISIVEVVFAVNNGSSPTIAVTTSGAPQVGDLLVVIHGNDFFDITNMVLPTVAPGAPTVDPITDGTADKGVNNAHVKSYTAYVNTAGAQTVSTTESGSGGEDKGITVYVLRGTATSNPVDDAANATGDPAPTIDIPSVTTTVPNGLMIGHINSGTGATLPAFTTPGSMTEQYEWHTATFGGVGATEFLGAAGPTGVRTFSPGGIPWAAITIAIKPSAAAPVDVDLTPASFTFTAVPVAAVPGPVTVAVTPASFTFSANPVVPAIPSASGPEVQWCAFLAPNWDAGLGQNWDAGLAPNWTAELVEECF
jgi:hypothetical protein